MYDGIHRDLVSMVFDTEIEYLNSVQDIDDTSDDRGLHNTLRRIQSGNLMDLDSIEWMYRSLDYRMT